MKSSIKGNFRIRIPLILYNLNFIPPCKFTSHIHCVFQVIPPIYPSISKSIRFVREPGLGNGMQPKSMQDCHAQWETLNAPFTDEPLVPSPLFTVAYTRVNLGSRISAIRMRHTLTRMSYLRAHWLDSFISHSATSRISGPVLWMHLDFRSLFDYLQRPKDIHFKGRTRRNGPAITR